ncbi:MAG: helix-turn-helix domain-containing protein [Rhodospirillaceae bacterium]|nr:helix-turn-helix domain-containing protein [Rhodospirillaceae bacterium]
MTAEALRERYPGLDALAVLVFLALCAGPAGGRSLSKKLGRAQSDVFRALSTLEEAGLIAAQPPVADDPLRRTVALTRAGLQLAAQTKTPPA